MNPTTIEILQEAIDRGDVFINENDKSVELHLRRLNLWHIFEKGDKLVISDWDEELGCFVVARKFIRSGNTGYALSLPTHSRRARENADRQTDCLNGQHCPTVTDWFSYCDRTATVADCRSSARARAYRARGNSRSVGAGVKRLALTHHDPDHDDEFLDRIEKLCRERFPNAVLAREGMEIPI
jgi:hypothetical protein